MASYTRMNGMKYLNCVLTHLHTYLHSCSRLFSFSATITNNYKFSEPCKQSLTIWKKQKLCVLRKGQTKSLLVPKLPRKMQRRKTWSSLAYLFWEFLFIDTEDLPDYIKWYTMWNGTQCFCDFETIICSLLMSGDK